MTETPPRCEHLGCWIFKTTYKNSRASCSRPPWRLLCRSQISFQLRWRCEGPVVESAGLAVVVLVGAGRGAKALSCQSCLLAFTQILMVFDLDQMSAPAGNSPHGRSAFAAQGRGNEVAPVAFDASGVLGAPEAGDGQSCTRGGAFVVPRRRSPSPVAKTSSVAPGRGATQVAPRHPGRAAVYALLATRPVQRTSSTSGSCLSNRTCCQLCLPRRWGPQIVCHDLQKDGRTRKAHNRCSSLGSRHLCWTPFLQVAESIRLIAALAGGVQALKAMAAVAGTA